MNLTEYRGHQSIVLNSDEQMDEHGEILWHMYVHTYVTYLVQWKAVFRYRRTLSKYPTAHQAQPAQSDNQRLGNLVTWWLGDLVTRWLGDTVTRLLGDSVIWWKGRLRFHKKPPFDSKIKKQTVLRYDINYFFLDCKNVVPKIHTFTHHNLKRWKI